MKMFTAKEKKNLEYVLSKASEEGDALYLDELHGLLFGLAITPCEIVPDEWVKIIFSEQPPKYDNEEDATACIRYLTDTYDRMVNDRKLDKLAFPFNYKKISEDDFVAIEGWVYGLFLAVSLRLDVWGLAKEYTKKDFEKLPEDVLELLDASAPSPPLPCLKQWKTPFRKSWRMNPLTKRRSRRRFTRCFPIVWPSCNKMLKESEKKMNAVASA